MKNLRKRVGETVVCHTRDGQSIQGILLGSHSDVHVLAHAHFLNEGGGSTLLGGEVAVPVGNVAFWQFGVEAIGS